jgi:16S rRNA (cytosine967-C5)-methyltransferase
MTSRELAVDALHRARAERVFVENALDEAFQATHFEKPEDRRLAANLALGVTRRRATLDALVAPFSQRPLSAIEPRVLDILHLGAFQIACLTSIPPHAAVHESVELARYVGSPMARGFINGVLRRVSECVTDEYESTPTAFTFPLEDRRFRRLHQPLLPDPRQEPALYLSAGCSWPLWLAESWLQQFGFQECLRLGFWFNAPPPLWLRVKPHVDRGQFQHRLAALNVTAVPGAHPQSFRIESPVRIADLPGYATGDFAVQDHASMAVATALAPQPGWSVLDLCAAPGGKTLHLAELMNNTGTITACDIDSSRLQEVIDAALRHGVTCMNTVLLNETDEPPAGPFDAVLVDAPCSNTGVLGRRVDVRWRITPRDFPHLTQLQSRLLDMALERVKPGGVVVYSTCSIEPAENGVLVCNVLRGRRDLRFEREHTSRPGEPSDGGYWARILKRSA